MQYLVALDKRTGKTVWQKDRDFHPPEMNGDAKKAYATPLVITVGGKPLLISPSAGATAAYDPKTGDEVWRVVHGGMNTGIRPVFGTGWCSRPAPTAATQLVAVRPDGHGNVTRSHVQWKFKAGVPNRSSVLLVGDNLLMVNSGGIATCVGAKDGKEKNKVRLETRGANVWASPIVAGGKMYVFDDAGTGFVLSADEKLDVLAPEQARRRRAGVAGGRRARPLPPHVHPPVPASRKPSSDGRPALSALNSALLVVDVQDKLLAVMPDAAGLVRDVGFLLDVANLLKVPALATEQYPQGLGPTNAELARRLPAGAAGQDGLQLLRGPGPARGAAPPRPAEHGRGRDGGPRLRPADDPRPAGRGAGGLPPGGRRPVPVPHRPGDGRPPAGAGRGRS